MKYVRNLANIDHNVMSASPQRGKERRPFVGIIVLLNSKKYCVPLSSPKEKFQNKKNAIDFMRNLLQPNKDPRCSKLNPTITQNNFMMRPGIISVI